MPDQKNDFEEDAPTEIIAREDAPRPRDLRQPAEGEDDAPTDKPEE